MTIAPPRLRGFSGRLRRLVRETWWLLVIVALASAAFGLFLAPVLGWVTPLVVAPVYLWFALIRVEDVPED